MKKMIAAIIVLAVIFVGMVIYKKSEISQKQITASEVEKIEQYISKIYMWKEVTKDALPEFEEVNKAPDIWIWETVKNNLEDYELTYEQIQNKAKELLGENFQKQFPKEGTNYLIYEPEKDLYQSTSVELDQKEDDFLINKIEKIKQAYQVEIVEYLRDYSQLETTHKIQILNLEEEIITTIEENEDETRTIDLIKENKEKFSKKIIELEKGEQDIFIKSVKVAP